MDQGKELYRAILENPLDDAPRLVYADWLEENGQVAQASFIRDQMAGKTVRIPRDSIPAFVRTMIGRKMKVRATAVEPKVGFDHRWFIYRRGFPDVLKIYSMGLFVSECARGLFLELPITSVVAQISSPYCTVDRQWYFFESGPWCDRGFVRRDLVRAIYKTSRKQFNFDTKEDANQWLSDLLVAYGRQQAGLTALTSKILDKFKRKATPKRKR